MKNLSGSVCLVISLVLFSSMILGQGIPQSSVTTVRISDNLYEIIGGRGANGGFYVGENGILVIDSKMDEKSVKETLTAIGKVSDKPMKFLVNTHSDGDHVAGNVFFPSSVTIVSHENCRNEFLIDNRDGSPSNWKKPEMVPFIPSVTFIDRLNLYLGSKKIELWYFGVGHTTGDIVVYFPEEKVAFLGDQLFTGRPPLIHSWKGGNSFGHVKALQRMLETLDAEKFCTGHNDPVDRNAVQVQIMSMQQRQAKVKALKDEKKSLDDIKAAFPENEARLVETIYTELSE